MSGTKYCMKKFCTSNLDRAENRHLSYRDLNTSGHSPVSWPGHLQDTVVLWAEVEVYKDDFKATAYDLAVDGDTNDQH